MTEATKYQHKTSDDNKVYTAVRYGNEFRGWDEESVPRVAKFVLGIDTDSRVTLANERILDVVQPDERNWRPHEWLANIQVIDWPAHARYTMVLGDWLLKDEQGVLTVVRGHVFETDYEPIMPEVQDVTEVDLLADLLYAEFPFKSEMYRRFTYKLAEKVIRSGWTKS